VTRAAPKVKPALVKIVKVAEEVQVLLVWSELRQRYVKGHPCILKRACPQCGAKKGQPCFGPNGHNRRAERHYLRTDAWQGKVPPRASTRAASPARLPGAAGSAGTRRGPP